MNPNRLVCILLSSMAVLAAGLSAAAAEAPQAVQPAVQSEQKVQAAPGAAQAGMVVVVDPETKELRAPVGNEAAELLKDLPALNQSSEGLRQVRLPDGSYMMNLEGRFQEYSLVRRDADGRLAPACVSGPEQQPGAPRRTEAEEK